MSLHWTGGAHRLEGCGHYLHKLRPPKIEHKLGVEGHVWRELEAARIIFSEVPKPGQAHTTYFHWQSLGNHPTLPLRLPISYQQENGC